MKKLLFQFWNIQKFYRKYLISIVLEKYNTIKDSTLWKQYDSIKFLDFVKIYVKKHNVFNKEEFEKLKNNEIKLHEILNEDENFLYDLEDKAINDEKFFSNKKVESFQNWVFLIKHINFDFFSVIERKIYSEIMNEIKFINIKWERVKTSNIYHFMKLKLIENNKLKTFHFQNENNYLYLWNKLLEYSKNNKEMFKKLFEKYWLVFSYIYSNFELYFESVNDSQFYKNSKQNVSYDQECFSKIINMKISSEIIWKLIKKAIKLWYLDKKEVDEVKKFFNKISINLIKKRNSLQTYSWEQKIKLYNIKNNVEDDLKEKMQYIKYNYFLKKLHVPFDVILSPFFFNSLLFWQNTYKKIRLEKLDFIKIITENYNFLQNNYDKILKNYITYLKTLKRENNKIFLWQIEKILWLETQPLLNLFQLQFIYTIWKNDIENWYKWIEDIIQIFEKYTKIIFKLNIEAVNWINITWNLLESYINNSKNQNEWKLIKNKNVWYDLIFRWLSIWENQITNEIDSFFNKNIYSKNIKKVWIFYQYFRDSFYSTNDLLKIIAFKNYLYYIKELFKTTKNKTLLNWIKFFYLKKWNLSNRFNYENTIPNFLWYFDSFHSKKDKYKEVLEIMKKNKYITSYLWKKEIENIYNFWNEYLEKYYQELKNCKNIIQYLIKNSKNV